jgi:hypothetical protein
MLKHVLHLFVESMKWLSHRYLLNTILKPIIRIEIWNPKIIIQICVKNKGVQIHQTT